MNSQTFSEERHAALWEEKSKQVGRWMFGTLVFGVLALVKVVAPYGEHAGEVQRLAGALRSNQTQLAKVTIEMTNNALVLAAVPGLLETIKRAPWKEEMEQLKGRFRQLGDQYRLLSTSKPTELRHLVRPLPDQPAPPEESVPERRRATGQGVTGSEPRGQTGARPSALQVDPSVLARGNAGRSAELSTDARAQAAGTFHLTPEILKPVQTGEQFRSTLRTNAIEVFRREAKQTREAVARSAENQVVKPLETLATKLPEGSAARASVSSTLAEMRAIISAPPPREASDDEWWQTIEGKDSVTAELQHRLDQKQNALQSLLARQQQALTDGQAALETDVAKLQAELARQQNELKQTEAEMQSLLPDWLRGLFGVPVLLQAYPLVLLVLGGVVMILARSTRNHFRRVRQAKGLDASALEDPATSTLWTLTWRGQAGTRATRIAYVGFYLVLAALQFAAASVLWDGLAFLDVKERVLPGQVVITLASLGAILSLLAALRTVVLLQREVGTVRGGGEAGGPAVPERSEGGRPANS